MSCFKAGTKFYILMTEYDIDYQTPTVLKSVSGLTYIPAGVAHNMMLERGYAVYDDLHMPGDYHPNNTYAYLTALSSYRVMFNENCNNVPMKDFEFIKKENVPGSNNTQKEQFIERMKECVEDALKVDLLKMKW